MTKQEFFQAVRGYVEENAVEPRAGFRSNNLSVRVGEYDFSIQGRANREGYVIVMKWPEQIANELPASHGGGFDESACREALAAIALTPKVIQHADDVITVTEHPRSYRVTFPYKHNRYALAGFHEAGMIWKSPNNVGGIAGEVYWVIQTHKLTRALEVIGYWYGENPLPGQRRYTVTVEKLATV